MPHIMNIIRKTLIVSFIALIFPIVFIFLLKVFPIPIIINLENTKPITIPKTVIITPKNKLSIKIIFFIFF